ncbi:hypothetical protein MRS44_015198 [Fusarium solani]|uniref:uncharacterized protein n=1 Tax=Fusarium solani TaxID=169388 RepID=UPI0032C433F9|nr:hypothetical protein MRS44_015198 [Fusarium solani]
MFLLWLTIWIRATSTASLYAYSTAKGVQVGAQDPKTGELHYSNCNSEKTPIFPIDKLNVLKVGLKSRKITALAAAGWWDGQKVTASIFYQTDESVIVNAYCEYSMTTGKLTYIDNWAISETAEVKSVNNETGLSVQLLGGEEGYRLFYHNKDGDVMMLRHMPKTTTWVDDGAISQDQLAGMALASAHYGKNISVAFPQGQSNIEVSRFSNADEWHLSAFPQPLEGLYGSSIVPTNETAPSAIQIDEEVEPEFSLPSWSPEIRSLGMSIDSSRSRSIFYIGADKKLYQVIEKNDEWDLAPNQTDKTWPQADDSSADLAVANDQGNGETWIYYWANDTIVQVHRKNSKDWGPTKTLPVNATNSANQNSDDNKGSQESTDSSGSKGLSTGVKAGIGVSVSMGVILIAGLIWFLMKRRATKKGQDTEEDGDPAPDQSPGSPEADEAATLKPVYSPSLDDTPKADPVEMESPRMMAELEHPPVIYELPENDGKQ